MLHLLKFESFKVQLCTSASTCPNGKECFRLLKLSKEIHTGKFFNYFKLILWLVKLFSRAVVKYLVNHVE